MLYYYYCDKSVKKYYLKKIKIKNLFLKLIKMIKKINKKIRQIFFKIVNVRYVRKIFFHAEI